MRGARRGWALALAVVWLAVAGAAVGLDAQIARRLGRSSAIVNPGPPQWVTSATLPGGERGGAYDASVACTGGEGTLFYLLQDAQGNSSSLPTGVSLDIDTGELLAGSILAAASTYQVWITCVDSGSPQEGSSRLFTLNVTVANPTITTDGTFTVCEEDQPCQREAEASGGNDGTFTWTLESGSLPPGMSLSTVSNRGRWSGTPTTAGAYAATMRVTDGLGGTATKLFSLTIDPAADPLAFVTSASLVSGQVDVPLDRALCGQGGVGSYAWTVTAGTVPTGTSLAASGTPCSALTGTPSAAGTYVFTAQIDDGTTQVTRQFTIIINDAPAPGTHPTLMFSVAELPSFRAYTHTYNSTWLQYFLDALDVAVSPGCQNTNTCGNGMTTDPDRTAGIGAINFALIGGILTPEWAEANGYTVSDDFDTASEACQIAYSFLLRPSGLAGAQSLLVYFEDVLNNEIQSRLSGDELHTFIASTTELFQFPIMKVYDWCYGQLTAPQKARIEAAAEAVSIGAMRIRGDQRTLASLTWTAPNVITGTLTAHGLEVGMSIRIEGGASGYNGMFPVASVPDANTFTVIKAGTQPAVTPSTGSPNVRIEGMREWPYDADGEASSNQILGNRGVYTFRFLGALGMSVFLDQGVLSMQAETNIRETIRRMFVNQVFHEWKELNGRDGKLASQESFNGNYGADTFSGFAMALLVGRTIPQFAQGIVDVGLTPYLEAIAEYYARGIYPFTWGSPAMWTWPLGTTAELYGNLNNTHANPISLWTGVCRVYGLACAGKLRWLMDQMYGAGATANNIGGPSSSSDWFHKGAYHTLLGGWGGVTPTPIDAASVSNRAGQESFAWGTYNNTDSSLVLFHAPEMANGGHAMYGGDDQLFGIWKHGSFILPQGPSGKGSYGGNALNTPHLSTSGIRWWEPSTASPVCARLFSECHDNRGTLDPTWAARDSTFAYLREGTVYAANPDHAIVGYAAADHSDGWRAPITSGAGSVKGFMQREVAYFKGLGDFAMTFDRSTLFTPTTAKRVGRWVVPVKPTCNDGTETKIRLGRWECAGTTVIEVENDSGTAFTASNTHSSGSSGPWPRHHVRGFILPVGSYETMALVGADPDFDAEAAALWPTNPQRNLEHQLGGASDRITNNIAERIGIDAAHNNNGADGCTYTLSDVITTPTLGTTLSIAGVFEHRSVSGRPGTNRITVTSGAGCPAISAASPATYALETGVQQWGFSADGRRLQGWGQFRIELPSSTNATEYFLLGYHWGDSDTFTTPTTMTLIDDADQRGAQAHGAGIEAVGIWSKTAPNPWTSSVADAVPTSTWPLGGSSVTYDFQCYAATAIRHAAFNFRPGSAYNVTVANPSGTNCTVTIAPTGGARTIGQDGMLTFSTTGTTVNN